MTRAAQAPHEGENGALAPRRETLALLQGVPKDLTHGDLDTTQEQHASSMKNDEVLKIEGEIEEEEHLKKKSIYPLSLIHI